MNKTKIVAISAIAFLALGGGLGYWWTTTPKYSLRQIEVAIDTHDVAKFRKHVDIEGLASNFIDDFLSRKIEEMDTADTAESLGTVFAAGMVQMMKPRLIEMAQEQVVRFVETGSADTAATSDSPSGADVEIGKVFQALGLREDGVQGIQYLQKDGKIALVGIGFRNEPLESDLVLELKLREMDGYWQLAELSNFRELTEKVAELEEAKVRDFNAPIVAAITSSLEVEKTGKRNRSGRWDLDKRVLVDLEVRNKSDKTIERYAAVVRLADPAGAVLEEMNVSGDHAIEPSQTSSGTWSIDVNMFDAAQNRLYELSSDDVSIEVVLHQIEFQDGTALRIRESFEEINSDWQYSFDSARIRQRLSDGRVSSQNIKAGIETSPPDADVPLAVALERENIWWYEREEVSTKVNVGIYLRNVDPVDINGILFELDDNCPSVPGDGIILRLQFESKLESQGDVVLLTSVDLPKDHAMHQGARVCGTVVGAW